MQSVAIRTYQEKASIRSYITSLHVSNVMVCTIAMDASRTESKFTARPAGFSSWYTQT